jgi:hypothetical protein
MPLYFDFEKVPEQITEFKRIVEERFGIKVSTEVTTERFDDADTESQIIAVAELLGAKFTGT